MKNTFAGGVAAAILFLAVLGCGTDSSSGESGKSNQPSNRPPSNSAPADSNTSTATLPGKTGVRECDELVDGLAAYSENPEDNFAVRAGKNYVVNRIKESVKQAIENNRANLGEMTSRCKEIKREFDRAMTSPQQQ